MISSHLLDVHDIDPQNIKILKQLITELERVKKQTYVSCQMWGMLSIDMMLFQECMVR